MKKTVLDVLNDTPKTVNQLATELGAKPGTVRMQLARTLGLAVSSVVSADGGRPALAYAREPGVDPVLAKAQRSAVSKSVLAQVGDQLKAGPKGVAELMGATDLSRSSVINALTELGAVVIKQPTLYRLA
jgi:DNA-binding IclR family transcriptional regulator